MSTPTTERRVVITGIGLISPCGCSGEELWSNLSQGNSGIVPCTATPAAAGPMKVAGQVESFTGAISDFGTLEGATKKAIRKATKLMCRETQMAVAAAQKAITDAGLDSSEPDPEGTGVVLGSDYMLTMPADYVRGVRKCADGGEFEFNRWGDEGLAEVEPLWMLRYLPNMPASHVAILNDLRGPNNSLTMREAAGLMAIGEAYRIVARGSANRMIAGATGTMLMPMQAIHAMQTEQLAQPGDDPAAASRPFDKNRTGMVAGEGAASVVIESLESAQSRGATIYGEVTGFGSSQVNDSQAKGINDIALTNAMRAALTDAKRDANQIGHLNAHGAGSVEGDIAEGRAIKAVFGDSPVNVTALKSYFGNLGAGSGVVELIGSLLALREGALPRILNYTTPDPDCPVAAVTDSATPPGDSFLSVNVTPQGQAAAVVVARPE